VNGADRSNDNKLIASADDWSLVNIFRNPCTKASNLAKSYRAHCSHVVRVKFDAND